MSTGDQSEYLRKKMAERRASPLAPEPVFMKSGFQRWAENERPARQGGAAKEPSQKLSMKADKDILSRAKSLGESMFAQYYKGSAIHHEGNESESDSESGSDLEGGRITYTRPVGAGYSGNGYDAIGSGDSLYQPGRLPKARVPTRAKKMLGQGKLEEHAADLLKMAKKGKGKLECVHHEEGEGTVVKKKKGGAKVPMAKAHGVKPSMKEYERMVGEGKKAVSAESEEEASGKMESMGSGRASRAALVKKVMKEKGLSLPQASKYVKEHGLYKK